MTPLTSMMQAAVDQYLHSSSWELPTLADYETLAAESEYAAWAIYNRYYLNHYTLSVHNLPKPYDTLEAFNVFLEQNGIVLNDAGGKIKQSPDGNLLQSSTVAGMVDAEFAGGGHKTILGSYVEFAERRVLGPFRHLPADQITPATAAKDLRQAMPIKYSKAPTSSRLVKDTKGAQAPLPIHPRVHPLVKLEDLVGDHQFMRAVRKFP